MQILEVFVILDGSILFQIILELVVILGPHKDFIINILRELAGLIDHQSFFPPVTRYHD